MNPRAPIGTTEKRELKISQLELELCIERALKMAYDQNQVLSFGLTQKERRQVSEIVAREILK